MSAGDRDDQAPGGLAGQAPDDPAARSPARAEQLSAARRELFERLASAGPRPRAGRAATDDGQDRGDGGGHQAAEEPFPLTEVQEAYWIGRDPDLPFGGVAAYGYGEFEVKDLDVAQLERAWNRLIQRHPALRTVISRDGTQRFLPAVPWYSIETSDCRGLPAAESAARLAALRAALSHRVPDTSKWPLFDVRATLLPGELVRVHVGFDTLIADARSFEILAAELDLLLADPEAELDPIPVTFRDYVLGVRKAAAHTGERSRAYWLGRIDDLPPAPDLALAPGAAASATQFTRYSAVLTGEVWRSLCGRAQARHITPSVGLLSAYAEVLAMWSGAPRFTLNLTLFNRRPVSPDIDRVVGCFTELALLAVDMAAGPTFEYRARQVQDQLWRDLEHRDVGAMTVLRELARRRGSQPLMPVVFTSALGTGGGGRNRLGQPVYAISQTPQVWIDHQVVESGDGVELWWDVPAGLFPPGMADDMFAAYQSLIEMLAADDATWQARRPAGPSGRMLAERRRVETAEVWAAPALLHEAVDLREPGRPAVLGADGALGRGELDVRASRLAAALQRHGAARNELVAVLTGRGPAQVTAVLGVLRSGAAYLPLAADLPAERLAALIARGRVRLVVTDAATASVSLPAGVRRIRADAGLPDDAPRAHGNIPGDLAYVIFTSGSTGTPKGVMISHESAAGTLHDMRRRLSLTSRDVVLAASDLSFDLSVFDIFGMLSAGGTIVTPGNGLAAKDPALWAELIDRHAVTVWDSVPALMGLLADHLSAAGRTIPGLRVALLSGDWIPVGLPDQIRQVAPRAAVIGAGGATEAAIWSVSYPVGRVDPSWTSIPYGYPLTNQTTRVRTAVSADAPDWVPGELLIGGAGVALGYWAEPATTADRFIPDPERPGGRLYRTGDYARHLPGGNLEFLGRRDAQVKVNGHRVDLTEIESALAAHPAVQQACVIVTGPRDGDRQLRGFVTPAGEVDVDGVRRHVSALLPGYMVPAVLEALPELPLTANGKVDRRALADRPQQAAARRGRPAPVPDTGARPVAEAVARIIAEVLGLEAPPDAGDDLLALGADSVAIVRAANRLERAIGFAPSLERVFTDPTVNGIAAECERGLLERASRPPSGPAGAALAGAGAAPAPALRTAPPDARRVALPGAASPDARQAAAWERVRSRRGPLAAPVPLAALAGLLGPLRSAATPVGGRRRYASAGALYPVRTYVAAADGSVAGLRGGVYYHDPVAHQLVSVGDGSMLRAEDFDPLVNQPVVRRAAFILLLAAYLPAIAPAYGAHAWRFALLEAGSMAQLLREAAPGADVALCFIGDEAAPAVRAAAGLGDDEQVVLMAAGGSLDPAEGIAGDGFAEAYGRAAARESGEL